MALRKPALKYPPTIRLKNLRKRGRRYAEKFYRPSTDIRAAVFHEHPADIEKYRFDHSRFSLDHPINVLGEGDDAVGVGEARIPRQTRDRA